MIMCALFELSRKAHCMTCTITIATCYSGANPWCWVHTVAIMTTFVCFNTQFCLPLFSQATTVIGQNKSRALFRPIAVGVCKNKGIHCLQYWPSCTWKGCIGVFGNESSLKPENSRHQNHWLVASKAIFIINMTVSTFFSTIRNRVQLFVRLLLS